ncbi:hypothetical protein QE152_g30984 [Popillia japonica]|uniref:Uncharacterized protein n=1 Tax=Popillia japonica TaxID=7064 RepID=A0AAW1JDD0_POPJA
MFVNNIYTFFSGSNRKWEILANFLTKKTNLTLKTLSKARWSARDGACRKLNEDWDEITQALKYISDHVHEKGISRSETAYYLRQLQKLETAFLSILWGDLLSRFNIVSKKVQSPETDLSSVSKLYGSPFEYIQSLTDEFDIYENDALVKSEVDLYEDEMKRKKTRKLHANEGQQGEVELVGRDNFRVNPFKVILDKLQSEMIKRKTVYDELTSLFGFLVEKRY